MCAKNNFYIFVPRDLDLWQLDLKFAPLVTLDKCDVSTKLEVSMAFLFLDNWTHGTGGQTDGWTDGGNAILNAASREGRTFDYVVK